MASKTAPRSQLRLEWVYGYRGHQCRNNVSYNDSNEVTFFVAGVAVVYNLHDHKQRFFLGHNDDLTCLSLHPDRQHAASGQVGQEPYICVWHTHTMATVSILKGGHSKGISCLRFSHDGLKLVSADLEPNGMLNVWDWKKGKLLAGVAGCCDRVFDVCFYTSDANKFVSCGIKHIRFWTLSGNTLTAAASSESEDNEAPTFLCVHGGPDGRTYAGTLAGDIYIWDENILSRIVEKAHAGGVFTVARASTGYITGGQDGYVVMWNEVFELISTIDVADAVNSSQRFIIRSVSCSDDRILVGTQSSEIVELHTKRSDRHAVLVSGHAEGELWALATHPLKQMFATGSDDCTLRLWNMVDKQMMAVTTLENPIRSCTFDADGQRIAVGLSDGTFKVLSCKDLAVLFSQKDRIEARHEMKYSPDGQYLAVGSNDKVVDLYSVSQKYKKVGQCTGSKGAIVHVDWSRDSKFIQANNSVGERLVYSIPGTKLISNEEEIREIHWHTWTSVIGPEINGIWGKYTDSNDVNATDANYDAGVVVAGDDFGLVKMFRFPTLRKGAQFRKYVGHSAHVTGVRFSSDKQRVISVGGADHAIFQWRFVPESLAKETDEDQEHNAFMDSNSEGSDSDVSDAPELDSDIEAERQISYDRVIGKEEVTQLTALAKQELPAGAKMAKAPSDGLTLTFVHGYRGHDCRNNLFYTKRGELVFHVAAVGIVYEKESHTQRFYLEHTDDILCLCLHPSKEIVATGQVGKDPPIHVWDSTTLKTLSVLKGGHQRGVCALDFSVDGKKLVTIGLDDNYTIVIWEWRHGEKLSSARGHNDKIFGIQWNPHEADKLVSVGMKHIKFWTQAGGGMTSQRGTFGQVAKLDSMMCMAFSASPGYCYTGGASGHIYVWKVNILERCVPAHNGPCFALYSLDKGFVSGGKDGVVSLWDEGLTKALKTYPIKQSSLSSNSKGRLVSDNPAIRAVVLDHGSIVVGTAHSEVLEIDKGGNARILVQGHAEKEVWGLACHPSKLVAGSVSDDCTLRIWDLGREHKMISCKCLNKPARCCAFSPDGTTIAVGFNDGSFSAITVSSLEEIVTVHHRKEAISDIRFSPDPGKYLAVASHDNFVDIYSVATHKRVGVCKGASSYVTHIDWDARGKLLVVNSGAREQLFFEAPRGHRQTLRLAELERLPWSSWTGVLGPTCVGIWPPKSDVTDVNAACLTRDSRLLATGDDFGFVKTFEYPVKSKFAKYKQYQGHSAHVTNVRFSHDDSLLVSAGGADTSIMVWSRTGKLYAPRDSCGDSEGSHTDSEEEGYDSDVQYENMLDFAKQIYPTNIRELEGTKPSLQENSHPAASSRPAVSRQPTAKQQPRDLEQIPDLQLEHIHGYRGFDCRSNLHLVNEGEDIVYNAAGAGIVLNLASGHQSFYLDHTDDIICLTVNKHPKYKSIVATGQIGISPCIHVWDASTKATQSILSTDKTAIGLCSLSFSCSGKLLVSVALDSQHTITLWRWQDGTKMATAPGHNRTIFHIEFRPDSDSAFVTVGMKHVKFWSVAGTELKGKRGVIRPASSNQAASAATTAAGHSTSSAPKMQTMLSVAFSAEAITYTGALSGDVYVWKDNQFTRLVVGAHGGPIFTMYTTLRDGLIMTGGKEKGSSAGCVKLWDQDMKRCRAYQIDTDSTLVVIKAVCRMKGNILIGTKCNSIVQVNEKTCTGKVILKSHAHGEVWGLSTHPKLLKFATAGDDGSVRLWDIENKTLDAKVNVGGPARSVNFNPEGDMLAVGLKSGEFCVLLTSGLKLWTKKRDRSSSISDIRFSPSGSLLAVGCEENCVDLYNVQQGAALTRATFCKGISSFVIQLDFSIDSSCLRVTCGAYTSQLYETATGNIMSDPKATQSIAWATRTSIVGDDVIGIWLHESGNGEVNCVDLTHSKLVLATGDDFGFVKLFHYPCTQKQALFKKSAGHSAHVTSVKFTYDDKYLISTGGEDCCVMVWKLT